MAEQAKPDAPLYVTWEELKEILSGKRLCADVSDSVGRYFAPVRGLIIGAEEAFGAPYFRGNKDDSDDDRKAVAG